MKKITVKTIEGVYEFENIKDVDSTNDNKLLMIANENKTVVCFPLCNIIYFNIEEASDE